VRRYGRPAHVWRGDRDICVASPGQNLAAAATSRYSRSVTQPPQTETTAQRVGRSPRFWIAVVAIVVLVIFVLQNSQKVEVDFLFTTTETPLIFALLIAGVLGALIGWAVPRIRRGERD
jgi:lipopolysaccharide assembly protein A